LRVLGIDPGIALTGYGIIESKNGSEFKVIDYGRIETSSSLKKSMRFLHLYTELCSIISLYQPDVVAIEELFFNKNSKTAITIGEARGVIILTCIQNNLSIYEYTPLQVKQSITGYGRANKTQIQKMVKSLLSLPEIPKPDDVADALAVAMCHILSSSSVLYQEDEI